MVGLDRRGQTVEMLARRFPPVPRRLGTGLITIVIAGILASTTLDADPDRGSTGAVRRASLGGSGTSGQQTSLACAGSSTAAAAQVDVVVARGIYWGELSGRELREDVMRVRTDQALLAAVASGNTQAAAAAVSELVYKPGWHIVRLRVLHAGNVLADVGGPDVIAPVSGAMKYQGRRIGTFVISVQDDAGYVKLVSRFIGTPIDIYRGRSFLMGTLLPAPEAPSNGAATAVAGGADETRLAIAKAFPSGSLRIAQFVPRPPPAVARRSCDAVRLWAWGSVAMHIASLFRPLASHYADLVGVLQAVTGGHAYVSAEGVRVAGAARPSQLPERGMVRLNGRTWQVYSWEPIPPARIYLLTPQG
jgi:hypothetical protein